jgi:RNA polymerase sigma factor (TIGR02999 family)
MSSESEAITVILARIRQGLTGANDELFNLLYDRFREGAHRLLRRERPGHSFDSADLAHEAWLRLQANDELARADNRNQLFRAFARAMRQVLIDHARRRNAAKRGSGRRRDELDDLAVVVQQRTQIDVLSLDESLKALAAKHSRVADVLEMRYFGACEMKEIADELSVSLKTVERDARFGLAWLRARLSSETNS